MEKVIKTETDLKETDVLQEAIETRLEVAMTQEIRNHEEYNERVSYLKNLKSLMKQWEDSRKGMVKHLDAAKREIQDFFRGPATKMKDKEAFIKAKLVEYDAKIERERQEIQRKIDAEAEKERKEKRRQELAWEEKEKKKREAADKMAAEGKEEEARKMREQANKDAEKAAERAEQAENIVAPVVAKPEPLKGISYSMKYTGEVIDFALLPDGFKTVNQGMLDRTLQSQKGVIPIPGVKIIERKIVTSRS
ncbi:MAG: hypothetical protein JRE23_12540 [Deltaproteobacteria bacterium]|nr:hypothetical protein [Deltaproteobacteria bacterium]